VRDLIRHYHSHRFLQLYLQALNYLCFVRIFAYFFQLECQELVARRYQLSRKWVDGPKVNPTAGNQPQLFM